MIRKNPKTIAQSLVKAFGFKSVEPLSRLISELDQYYAAARQSAYFKSLKAPMAKVADKRKLLSATLPRFPFGADFGATVRVLVDLNQLADLPKVVVALREIRLKEFKVVEAEVVTAKPLSGTQQKQASKLLSKISGSEVLLAERVNPAVLGGLVLKLGDTVIDASLARKIREMKKQLSQ